MGKQQTSRQQQMDERNRREQDVERNKDFGDRAVEARLPDDPRAMAPRDAIGRPSTGEPI
ncbi:hypothetical protein [Micromonospora parathelypteridis]|uniref:Uncharacterized protein n=1 Tax=Micromonospora parathelypteridis TaxID=1839617 RepID=A0A840VP18_9ACTN|nr:hypothetical protein [Micromonospora parathelypteridis]MBB5478782.1 hypothetical protein [Micromonospora parathelypteridis]GGO04554.1 hypothetical protein GCM10011576_06240 [Micromonospora parathelypteridis]